MALTTATKIWLYGLASAGLGALAHAAGDLLIAPATFNLTSIHGLRMVVMSCGISAVTAVVLTLSKSPLPNWDWVQQVKRIRSTPDGGQQSTITTTAGTGEAPPAAAPVQAQKTGESA